MSLYQAIAFLAGGLVFFVFGLENVNRSIGRLSGAYLKVALNLLTSNRIAGAAVGAVSSFLLASTSAATVLFAGMGDTGLLTLRQALPVMLGAAVGTTLTVQIIAFDVGNWAVFIIVAGFLFRHFAGRQYWRDAGRAVFGLGLVFYGIAMMKNGVQTATNTASLDSIRSSLATLSFNPFYLFLLGIVLTAILQSSAITMALAFAFLANDPLAVRVAVPIALGASVGTCSAGLISGIASRPIGRQIAVGHFVMKLLGASFFMLILGPFTHTAQIWSERLGTSSNMRVIANANTLFSLLYCVIFLPLVPVVEQLVLSLVRGEKLPAPLEHFSLSDLDDAPGAVRKAHAQTARLGRTVLKMLRQVQTAFLVDAGQVVDEMKHSYAILDTCDTVLSDFLRRIDEGDLSSEDNHARSLLLYYVRDIRYIGDVAIKQLLPLAVTKSRKGLDFSIEGAQQFERYHRLIADDFCEVLDHLEGLPADLKTVLSHAHSVDAMRSAIGRSHVMRVSRGVTADIDTSRILLDAVASLRAVHYYICDMINLASDKN